MLKSIGKYRNKGTVVNPAGFVCLHVWKKGGIYELVHARKMTDEWNNIAFSVLPYPPPVDYPGDVRDIRNGLPYKDNLFDFVLVTRIIEHLTFDENQDFFRELFRVTKPKGTVRCVTPDLHAKAINYVQKVKRYEAQPTEMNYQNLLWAIFDLNDQSTRPVSGGMQLELARSGHISFEEMRETHGDVFDYLVGGKSGKLKQRKISDYHIKDYLYAVVRRCQLFFSGSHPQTTREANMWMYDELSLKDQLLNSGFINPRKMEFDTTSFDNYGSYLFDKSPHGNYPVEPSLYMEAIK